MNHSFRFVYLSRLSSFRRYTTPSAPKSPHAQWYADVVPAMVPIALLGSAVYLGLQLAQSQLSHDQYLDEARARVNELEAKVDALQTEKETNPINDTASTASTRS